MKIGSMTEQEFYTELQKTEFGQRYIQITSKGKISGKKIREKGYDFHHIFPRAFGGTNAKRNLSKLSRFDHILAHYFLARAIPCNKTLFPISALSNFLVKDLTDLERTRIEELEEWFTLREQSMRLSENKGRVRINKDGQSKLVAREDLKDWEERGWQKGFHVKSTLGKIHIKSPDGTEELFVSKEDFESNWEPLGWIKGSKVKGKVWMHRGCNEEIRVSKSEISKYEREGWTVGVSADHVDNRTGFRRIWKEGQQACVPESEVESYLKQGWTLGINFIRTKGKVSVYRGMETKFCLPEDLQKYLEGGWQKGRPKVKQGACWIHRGGEVRRVTSEEIEQWVQGGWTTGKGPTCKSPEGSVTLKKDGKTQRVYTKEAVESLLKDGWELRGRKSIQYYEEM